MFDPTVSPDYKVFSIKYVPFSPSPDFHLCLANRGILAHEWPPSTFVIHVFSSRRKQWEKSFIRGGAAGTIGDMFELFSPYHRYAEYWRGALYVHQHDFLMRYLANFQLFVPV